MAEAETTPKTEDQLVQDMIAEVQRRRTEIRDLETPRYATNLLFSYNEASTVAAERVNLQVQRDTRSVLKIAAFLRSQKTHYDEAVREMAVEDAPAFTWQGYAYESWMSDLHKKIEVIHLGVKRAKLDTLEKRLDAIITPEARRKMELEAIQKELSQ